MAWRNAVARPESARLLTRWACSQQWQNVAAPPRPLASQKMACCSRLRNVASHQARLAPERRSHSPTLVGRKDLFETVKRVYMEVIAHIPPRRRLASPVK